MSNFNIPEIRLPRLDSLPSPQDRARSQYEAVNIAQGILRKLIDQVRIFESSLNASEEAAISIETTNGFEQVGIEKVFVLAPDALSFHGRDSNGNRVVLFQHVSQANVLLRAIPKQHDKAHRIGFEVIPVKP